MDGYVTIGTELDTKIVDKQIKLLEDKLEGLLEEYEILEKAEPFEGQSKELIKLGKEIESTRKKIAQLNKQQTADYSGISKGISGTIKKITRWSLAVFGIRSAYMAVRNSINAISQEDDELAADIDYIKTALAYVLEPVIRKIVEWAKQLVFYIGYLIKAWTGHDIFASANKNLKKSVGSAKELNKQLAGFDEMNVLSDTSSSGGAGAGSTTLPTFNFEDMEVPEWLLTIERIGKWILDNWEDVVTTLLLTKLFIDILTGNWLGVIIDLVLILIAQFFKLKDTIKVIKDNWQEAWTVMKDKFNAVISNVKDKFASLKNSIKNIISDIVGLFKNIGTKVGDAVGGAFKAVVNGVLKAIENILNFPIKQVNKLLDVINAVPGINIKKLSTFSLPRLAKGGIVNMPSRGVPVGSAIAGERGAEGVIPLTDSQQMALLGEAIGKYITINANIVNTMNGRVISKELQRVQNDSDFAFNR